MSIRLWSTTPASNNSSPPNGAPEGMAPSGVNNTLRQIMAEVRDSFEDLPWFDYGHTPTRVDNDTFTVPTDLTAIYTAGRRLQLVGATTGYATISSSSYSAPDTTVNVTMDSGNVPTSLTNILVNFPVGNSPVGPYIPTTAAETAASVTPSNFYYPPGDSRRYGATDTDDGVQGWFDYGYAATRASTTSFTVSGDRTSVYVPQRRCKMIGGSTTYGRILTATFATGTTTVTLAMDGSSVVPNPMTLAPVQVNPVSLYHSSITVDADNEVYALLVGNRNNGTSAVGKMIVGGGNSSGAFTGAVAIAACPSTHGEYLVGSGISGAQAVIHTGASLPIIIGTSDVLRMYFPSDGSEMKITSDLLLDKLAATNSRGKIRINGTTDSMLELDSAGTQIAYFFATSSLTTIGTVTNTPFRIITNNTERLRMPAGGLGNYANDSAAATGGVAVGEMYRNGSVLMVRVS